MNKDLLHISGLLYPLLIHLLHKERFHIHYQILTLVMIMIHSVILQVIHIVKKHLILIGNVNKTIFISMNNIINDNVFIDTIFHFLISFHIHIRHLYIFLIIVHIIILILLLYIHIYNLHKLP